MKIERGETSSKQDIRLYHVPFGVVFHLAQNLFKDAINQDLFYIKTNLPTSDDFITVINISTGLHSKFGRNVHVIPRKSKCVISKDIVE